MDTPPSTLIRDTIKAGRIVEAQTLLTMHRSELEEEEFLALEKEIDRLYAKAEEMISVAKILDKRGKAEEAKVAYESVQQFASDFPHLDELIRNIDESMLLARAVKKRKQRQPAPPQPTPEQTAPPKRKIPLPIVAFSAGILLAILLAVFFHPFDRKTAEETPQPATVASAPPIQPPAEQVEAPPIPQTNITAPPEREPPPPKKNMAVIATAPKDPEKKAGKAPVTSAPAISPPQNASTQKTEKKSPAPPAKQREVAAAPKKVSQPKEPPRTTNPTKDDEKNAIWYTIQRGDSLSNIAYKKLCNQDAWRQLYELNKKRVPNLLDLKVGMRIRLDGLKNKCGTKDQPAPRSNRRKKTTSDAEQAPQQSSSANNSSSKAVESSQAPIQKLGEDW